MNEEYLKLKKRIETELINEYRATQIVTSIIEYYGIGRQRVLGDSQIQPVILVRHMIAYVSYFIYGIPLFVIAKHLKYKDANSAYHACNAMKLKIDGNKRVHSDLEHIRLELVKVLNG